MLRKVLAGTCVLTIVIALWFAINWMARMEGRFVLKILGCGVVILQCLATWRWAARGTIAPWAKALVVLGAAALVALGVSAVVQQMDPTIVDFEGYVLVTGFVLTLQGLLTLVLALADMRRVAPNPGA